MYSADDKEAYLLLLLSDSNLPTGSFVASSGLESYVKHGFSSSASTPDVATVDFLRDSLASYASSALPFISDAHRLVERYASDQELFGCVGGTEQRFDHVIRTLTDLDELYQAMTLNHVARRASMSQGVALLTLYAKGFSRTPSLSAFAGADSHDHEARMKKLLEQFKTRVRREEVFGHLPICWGALTAALGLSLERAQYLHLFLHARSLLSASVRLNDLGPYGAQQILLHAVRPLVAAEATRCRDLRTGLLDTSEDDFDETTQGPANTWPLGEILACRHDLQHSRIFNS
ncbi:UreF-domain-containing protein [Crassisporium funariophilum]|nr:UreF-domain-containing protein [Crassisporium funariophilum]